MAYNFTQDWFSHNISYLQNTFFSHSFDYINKPIRVLEIGCWEGRSTCWMLDTIMDHPHSQMISVDTFQGSLENTAEQAAGLYDRFMSNVAQSRNASKLQVIKNQSVIALAHFLHTGDQFDLIYVDGSHEYEDVTVDAILSWRLLKTGGIIIFDDYEKEHDSRPGDQAVKRALSINFEPVFNPRELGRSWQIAYTKD